MPGAHTLNQMRTMIPRAHFEIAQGTAEQNFKYCSGDFPGKKPNKYFENGDRPAQGRAQWDLIESAMKNPRDNPKIVMQYRKTYDYILNSDRPIKKTLYVVTPEKLEGIMKRIGYKLLLWTHENTTYKPGDYIVAILDKKYPSIYYEPIKRWWLGVYDRIVRGYEVVTVCPAKFILVDKNPDRVYMYLIDQGDIPMESIKISK